MAERSYSKAAEAALWMLSQGRCYKPGCRQAAMTWGPHADPTKELEIAHICAISPGGPRYEASMTDRERNEFPNLLVLCRPHHKDIDVDEVAYPTAALRVWKARREQTARGRLDGLRYASKEDLEGLLEQTADRIRKTLADVSVRFPEMAQLLREALQQRHLDRDTAELINAAARSLQLPDSVPLLSEAASRLQLPDMAPQISEAAEQLSRSTGSLSRLADAVELLMSSRHSLDSFAQAAQIVETASHSLETSVQRIESAQHDLARSAVASLSTTAPAAPVAPRVVQVRQPVPARVVKQAFGWGFLCGVVAVIVIMAYGG